MSNYRYPILILHFERDSYQLIRSLPNINALRYLDLQGQVLVVVVLIDQLDHTTGKGRVGFLAKENRSFCQRRFFHGDLSTHPHLFIFSYDWYEILDEI